MKNLELGSTVRPTVHLNKHPAYRLLLTGNVGPILLYKQATTQSQSSSFKNFHCSSGFHGEKTQSYRVAFIN